VERSGASAAVDGLRQLLGDQDRLSQVQSIAKTGWKASNSDMMLVLHTCWGACWVPAAATHPRQNWQLRMQTGVTVVETASY